jgi:diguanylate cyclase (GGDEF)-like protein/PAS domain S-box-containing protein/hemerythrin-like metal-binding protein
METLAEDFAVIPWNVHFETGLDTIDEQHRQLVGRLNDLAMRLVEGRDQGCVNELFAVLLDHMGGHFSAEEAIWAAWLDDDEWVATHHGRHVGFISEVENLRSRTAGRAPDEIADVTLGFLTRWLPHHILADDQRLARMALAMREGLSRHEAARRADDEISGRFAVLSDSLLSMYETLSAHALTLMREKQRRQRAENDLQATKAAESALRQQHDMRYLVNELAADLMAATTGDFDFAVDRILQRSGEYFSADRAYVFIRMPDGLSMSNTHEWCASGVEPQRECLKNVPVDATPWWWREIGQTGYVLVPDVATLPDEAAAERDLLESQGIRSLCAFPLKTGDIPFGFVGFDAVRERRDWTDHVIEFGRTIGDLIGIAVGHSQMHRALRVSEKRYRALFESLADAVIVADTESGVIVDANRQAEVLTGHGLAQMRALRLDALHPNAFRDEVERHLLVTGEAECVATTELVVRHRHGHLIPVEVRSAGHYRIGDQALLVSVYRDISERKRAEERFRHMAQHDTLTGLPNRARFDHLFKEAIEEAQCDQTCFALLFMDLDNLKPINDRLGHAVGDLLLKDAAERIRAVLRASDNPARVGGDEFLVLLRNIHGQEDAATVAEKIRRAISRPFSIEGRVLEVSLSIGIALYPDDGADALTLFRHADEAMYRAKSGGKNGVVFYGASV